MSIDRTFPVTIREFSIKDYDAIVRLWTEAGLPFRPHGRDGRDRLAAEARRGTSVFLVAEVDGRLAGVVLGTHDGRKAWINRLAVSPSHRRRGIAQLLIGELEARMTGLGIDVVAALIESANRDSMAFFSKIGYVHDLDIEYFSKRRSEES